MPSVHPTLCISIVSHGQGQLVYDLLASLEKHCPADNLKVAITLNIEEDFSCQQPKLSYPVTTFKNVQPKGFGANHNAAFKKACTCDFFCVLNPDILLLSNPFPELISILSDPAIGVIGPSLTDSRNQLQDSARPFPTPTRILRRRIQRKNCMEYTTGDDIFFPDWIAGMFMLFPTRVFADIQGFDERYFMYCEDADLCLRLKRKNLRTAYAAQILAVHNARRSSHGNLQHLAWHLRSLFRFFTTYAQAEDW